MRVILNFLLLLMLITSARTQGQNSEFRIAIFNDSWGGGATPIYDDLRTYGAQLGYYRENRFKVESTFSHLTNQFDTDTIQRKSLDELVLIVSIPIVHFNKEKEDNIWLQFGGMARGSIFGNQIQNLAHETSHGERFRK